MMVEPTCIGFWPRRCRRQCCARLRRAACGHPCRIPPARPRPRSRGSGDLQHRYQSGEQIEQLCAAGEQVGKTGEVWPKTREQRCWVHKTANVIAKLPKSQQPKAKRALQEIWMAETKAAAELA